MLALTAAATWWLGRGELFAPDEPTLEDSAVPAGYYLRGARLFGTDEDGRIVYTLSAAEAQREGDEGPIELTEVELRYTPEAQVPWRLTSDHAEVSPDLTLLTLTGDVVAVSDEGPIVIRTPSLRLDTERHIAETREAVEMEMPEGRLRSVGLTALLDEERLQLESEVHGTFVP